MIFKAKVENNEEKMHTLLDEIQRRFKTIGNSSNYTFISTNTNAQPILVREQTLIGCFYWSVLCPKLLVTIF